jgi:hypothetical protein
MEEKISFMLKLKNDSGKHYTKQLFHEMWSTLDFDNRVGDKAPFTLYQDRPNHINFGKAYVDLADPSGYRITQLYLNGDYKHWIALTKCSWFNEAKEVWDKELEAKLFAEGMEAIKDIAKDETHKGRLQAAKILVDKGYASKMDSKGRRGRPSTEEVSGYLKEEASAQKALQDDLERIRSVN